MFRVRWQVCTLRVHYGVPLGTWDATCPTPCVCAWDRGHRWKARYMHAFMPRACMHTSMHAHIHASKPSTARALRVAGTVCTQVALTPSTSTTADSLPQEGRWGRRPRPISIAPSSRPFSHVGVRSRWGQSTEEGPLHRLDKNHPHDPTLRKRKGSTMDSIEESSHKQAPQ